MVFRAGLTTSTEMAGWFFVAGFEAGSPEARSRIPMIAPRTDSTIRVGISHIFFVIAYLPYDHLCGRPYVVARLFAVLSRCVTRAYFLSKVFVWLFRLEEPSVSSTVRKPGIFIN